MAKILVVEDDEHIGFLLESVLAREGFEVVRVSDGLQAVAAIREGPAPSLVLLDLMLPHVSGEEIVAAIRADPAWRGVPILVLTAKSGERDIVRALDAGANDYVVKPFGPDALLARIRRLLRPEP